MWRSAKHIAVAVTTPIVVACGILITRGYQSGVGDHFVLSALGISWSDKSAYVHDYFVANSTQPHWAFDYFSAFFESHFGLSIGYALYWLVSVVVIGHALLLVAKASRTTHPLIVSVLAAVFLVIGPVSILGTTTPAVGIAIPHMLGLSLAMLTLGLLLNERHTAAGAAAIAACLTHVQHGVISIGFLSVSIAVSWFTKHHVSVSRYLWVAASACAVLFDLKFRPIIAGPKDFVYICSVMVPYHCDVTSWKHERFVLGAACALLTLVLAYCAFDIRRNRLLMVISFAGIIVLSIISIVTALKGIHKISDILQSLNVYRLNSILIPMAALALAYVVVEMRNVRLPVVVVTAIAGFYYLTAQYDNALLKNHHHYVALALILISISKLISKLPAGVFHVLARFGSGAAIAVLLVGGSFAIHTQPALRAYTFGSLNADTGLQLEKSIPVGQTITMDPKLGWVRLLSRRAVVVDCKYKPYGGESLHEYVARLQPLGGFKQACQKQGFNSLSATQLTSYATRYNSHFLLLRAKDPRINKLTSQSWAPVRFVDGYELLKDKLTP